MVAVAVAVAVVALVHILQAVATMSGAVVTALPPMPGSVVSIFASIADRSGRIEGMILFGGINNGGGGSVREIIPGNWLSMRAFKCREWREGQCLIEH